MANYSRWDDIKNKRPAPSAETRVEVERDLALGQLIHDLRTEEGLLEAFDFPAGGVVRAGVFLFDPEGHERGLEVALSGRPGRATGVPGGR